MPSIILRGAPQSELAAANGLNTLHRSVGSSLASAAGGTVLAAQTISLAGHQLPSLAAYQALFATCAGAALLGAAIALAVPGGRDATSPRSSSSVGDTHQAPAAASLVGD
jgi:hypothetical protein